MARRSRELAGRRLAMRRNAAGQPNGPWLMRCYSAPDPSYALATGRQFARVPAKFPSPVASRASNLEPALRNLPSSRGPLTFRSSALLGGFGEMPSASFGRLVSRERVTRKLDVRSLPHSPGQPISAQQHGLGASPRRGKASWRRQMAGSDEPRRADGPAPDVAR